MQVVDVVAEVLKREGVKFLIGYPVNHIIEAAAEADIRTIIVRQERTGVHMADAGARLTSGESVGIFCMQGGPGVENSFGAVAQAYSEAVPMIVIPGGAARAGAWVKPAFNAALNYQHNDTTLIYGSYAKGYKAGGVNLVAGDAPFKPETNTVEELGGVLHKLLTHPAAPAA